MLQMPLIPSGHIVFVADLTPLQVQATEAPAPPAHDRAGPIGLAWLILIALAVFALVYIGLRLRSNARK